MTTNWYIEAKTSAIAIAATIAPANRRTPNPRRLSRLRSWPDRARSFRHVQLDGLHYAVTYAWPGAIFEGNGTMQVIIDERADDQQRQALTTVLHGGETEEAKTHWWVFHAMSSTVHEPIFTPFEFTVEIERRTARVSIPECLSRLAGPSSALPPVKRTGYGSIYRPESNSTSPRSGAPRRRRAEPSRWTSTTATDSSTWSVTRGPRGSRPRLRTPLLPRPGKQQ